MVIFFFGVGPADIVNFMPTLVETLGVGHEKYSALSLPATSLFDINGDYVDEGIAIGIPGFEHVREHPEVLGKLSEQLNNVPVFMVNAPVDGWINGVVM